MRLAALVVCLCVLAGCGATPPADDAVGTVDVSLDNAASDAYAVSLSVTRGPLDGVRVTYANGTERTFEVRDVSEIPPATLDDAVAIDPQGPGVRAERYDLPPRSGVGATLTMPRASTLVYVVTNASGVRSWGQLRCGPSGTLSAVRITVAADGRLAVASTCS